MRKYATIKKPLDRIKKVMIFEKEKGVYLFLYDSIDDVPGFADEWYETLEAAEEICKKKYSINPNDWIYIDDPIEYCQDDIIAPVRVKGTRFGPNLSGEFLKN